MRSWRARNSRTFDFLRRGIAGDWGGPGGIKWSPVPTCYAGVQSLGEAPRGARLRANAPVSAWLAAPGGPSSLLNTLWLTQRSPLTRLRHQGVRGIAARLDNRASGLC